MVILRSSKATEPIGASEMTTSIERHDARQVARPLKVLVTLIKKDLADAQNAADRAAEPYKIAAAEKFAEARSQTSFSEYISWCHRNFQIRETQAVGYLSVGRYKENYTGAPKPITCRELPGIHAPPFWRACHIKRNCQVTDDETITSPTALAQVWLMEARRLDEAAKQEDIGDDEAMLNKYIAARLHKCIRQLDTLIWANG